MLLFCDLFIERPSYIYAVLHQWQ